MMLLRELNRISLTFKIILYLLWTDRLLTVSTINYQKTSLPVTIHADLRRQTKNIMRVQTGGTREGQKTITECLMQKETKCPVMKELSCL